MTEVARQHCHVHPSRQAAARCPECRNSFCRECVTEHAGRVICSRCLAQMREQEDSSRRRVWPALVATGQLLVGAALLWVMVYHVGPLVLQVLSAMLMDVPSEGVL
jgi:uncharacterized paraquat-inducible protein A